MKRWKAWQSRLWHELGNVQLHDGRGSTGQRGGSKEKPLGGGGAEKEGFREETEGECGMLCWLPSNSQSPFLFPIARCPATGWSKPFMEMPSSLPVSSLRMNMWLYFGQWDVRGWSSWKAPLLDERGAWEKILFVSVPFLPAWEVTILGAKSATLWSQGEPLSQGLEWKKPGSSETWLNSQTNPDSTSLWFPC